MTASEHPIQLQSGELRLQGALREGAGALAVVVLHPHPRFGGDMDNHVVTALCEEWAAAGASTLRFNFRGVGNSEGAFDGAGGEQDDARAAIREVRRRWPKAGVVLAGYSFGAGIAASVATESGLRALILVSPPVALTPLAPLPAGLETLIVTGADDPVAPASALSGLAGPQCRLAVVPGAGHSWWPGLESLSAEIRAFVERLAS